MVAPRRAQEDHPHSDITAPGTATGTRFWRGDGTWQEPPAGDDDNAHYLGKSLYQWVHGSSYGTVTGSSSVGTVQTVWTTTGTALQKLPVTTYGIGAGDNSYRWSSNDVFHEDYIWSLRIVGGLWKLVGNGFGATSTGFFGAWSANIFNASTFSGIGFRFLAGDANWQAATGDGTSVTSEDTGVPVVVDEPYSFEFNYDGAGSVRMLIRNLVDGDSYDTTIGTTMPTAAMDTATYVHSDPSHKSYMALSTMQGVVDWESGL